MEVTLKILDANKQIIGRAISFILSVWLFLFALSLMGDSFDHLGNDSFKAIINAVSNPFIGLFTGLIITAIIQSSSTTTTMVVAAVATGSITLHNAVPVIMGANIGTTITSMLISLSFINKKEEFKKAIATSAVHNLFNITVVLLLFPLEVKYGVLTNSANYFSSMLFSDGTINSASTSTMNLLYFSWPSEFINNIFPNSIISLVISFLLLFISIKWVSKIIYQMMIGDGGDKLHDVVFKNSNKSFIWGTLATAAIQSSSITTSLVVPLVATSKTTMEKAIPFIIGANIGTTITAFIAVIYKSNTAASIAMAHLLFNVFGMLFYFSSPVLRILLATVANAIGNFANKYRISIFIYILFIFFVIPFILIFLNQ